MSIELIEVKTRAQLKAFIYLPEKLHKDRPNWVPPIYMDEWAYFNPKKNKAFSYSDTILLLAEKDGQVVGRVMGIINRRYNEVRNEKTARFGFLESVQDQAVVHALLGRVEEWARERGMTRIIGPYGFSDQDPEGFLIKGFENRATIATYYNFEWLPEMVEKEGYTKDIDYFVYKIDVPKEVPEIYKRIAERILKRGFQLLEFRSKKELKPWIRPILVLMNETYIESNIYGYAPLDEKEMDDLAKKYMPVLDPRFIKGVLKDGQVVAFIVAIPDMTAGIKKARGRLLPFGLIHILRAQKKTRQLDLLLGAIKKEYRGMGLDALMGVAVLTSAQKAGFEIMDTHHEMEANVRVRSEMERLGGQIYKIYRVYQKPLV
ncbi:MAG: GNAT family N-acetyltransferase [Candidatus Saccharicenans sp.]|nr:GNAT family N-acetyltransferase [Candidatus Saccharicenans sp.]MDI6848277.1 GNAT family N-acetyltransferase [Candidatus Saccharicenans sp.]